MKHLVVVCGGRSAEHEVSLRSAAAVLSQFDGVGFRISVLGITKEGGTLPADRLRACLDLDRPDSCQFPQTDSWISYLQDLDREDVVVFPVLHGPYGEDGTIQGLLEMLDLAYVGAGVGASAVAMNKIYCKSIWKASDLPVLAWSSLCRSEWERSPLEALNAAENCLGWPIFVKPANMGSSVGLNKSHNRGELLEHVQTAFRYDDYVLLERGIEAREIEVSVLGGFEPRASLPGEIVPADEFYSYEAKYLKEGSRLLIPAALDQEQVRVFQDLAVGAFRVLQLDGMARVDFLLEKSTGKIWLNEPNTIPGFTQISMYPKLWEATGMTFPELLRELVRISLERRDRRRGFSVER